MAAASAGAMPSIPPLQTAYRHDRTTLGQKLYGQALGIPRDDAAAQHVAVMKNYEFFGAPVAAVLAMGGGMEKWDAMSVGLYLQTFTLALTERRLGTYAQVSIAEYPEVRKELGIGEDLDILCGLAIGFPDEGTPVNHLPYERDAVQSYVHFFDQ